MSDKRRKLELKKETIQVLTSGDLGQVAGGDQAPRKDNTVWYTCNPCEATYGCVISLDPCYT